MVNYNIGDLVTRINNSYRAGSGCNPPQVLVEKTKDNYQILNLLIKLGCLANINNPTNLNKFSDVAHHSISAVRPPRQTADMGNQPPLANKEHPHFVGGPAGTCKQVAERERVNYYIVDLNVNSGDTQPRKATLISQKPKNKLTLVSKPGKRIYVGYRDLKDFNHGFKTYILRTSKGIITSQTAIKLKIGGELLIKV